MFKHSGHSGICPLQIHESLLWSCTGSKQL